MRLTPSNSSPSSSQLHHHPPFTLPPPSIHSQQSGSITPLPRHRAEYHLSSDQRTHAHSKIPSHPAMTFLIPYPLTLPSLSSPSINPLSSPHSLHPSPAPLLLPPYSPIPQHSSAFLTIIHPPHPPPPTGTGHDHNSGSSCTKLRHSKVRQPTASHRRNGYESRMRRHLGKLFFFPAVVRQGGMGWDGMHVESGVAAVAV